MEDKMRYLRKFFFRQAWNMALERTYASLDPAYWLHHYKSFREQHQFDLVVG